MSSALCSPERERLNEPQKTTSSATGDLRVHEVVEAAGRPRRGVLPGERRAARGSSRAAGSSTPTPSSPSTARGRTRAASRRRSRRRRRGPLRPPAPASPARGPRRSPASRCGHGAWRGRSPSPRDARARRRSRDRTTAARARPPTSTRRGSTRPTSGTGRPDHSSSNASEYASPRSGDSTVTRTFSCRVQESSVQFVDPVSTAASVAHRELVMHEVRDARDRQRRRPAATRCPRDALCRRRRHRDRVGVIDVVHEPHRDAALAAPAAARRARCASLSPERSRS